MSIKFFTQFAPVLSVGNWKENKHASYGQINYVGLLPDLFLDGFTGEAQLCIVVHPNRFVYFVDVAFLAEWGEVTAAAVSQKVAAFDCCNPDKMPAQERWDEAIAISKELFPQAIQKYKDWKFEVLKDGY